MPEENLQKRPPVVVVLGHIDHGKTTLLDRIRKTKVAEKEKGAITQEIGAYEVEIESKETKEIKKITFIDTPGHEDFKEMRESGLRAADLAILIIAVDEGVKEQTKEIISFLKERNFPFIVAFNKIDKSGGNVQGVINQLLQQGVLLEKYGGDVSWQEISAKTGEGIDELLDIILLTAEMMNLEYNPLVFGKGIVIEVEKTGQRGIEVSAILKDGFLKQGLYIKTPSAQGKIRILEDFLRKKKNILYPSSPARIVGFKNLPLVGEEFICSHKPFQQEEAEKKFTFSKKITKEIKNPVILKARDFGSLSALKEIIKNYPLHIVSCSVGDICLNDLQLAKQSKCLILGFKVGIERSAENFFRASGVKIISSELIYEIIKNLEQYLKEKEEKIIGELEILALFRKEKNNQIVGGRVISGEIQNNKKFKIERENKIIGQGKLLNLESNKKKVEKVSVSQEAGLMICSDVIIKEKDKLIFFDEPSSL